MMYKTEMNIITPLLDKMGIQGPVRYQYNYSKKKIMIYAKISGEFIDKHVEDIEILRNVMREQRLSDWTVELVGIKDDVAVQGWN